MLLKLDDCRGQPPLRVEKCGFCDFAQRCNQGRTCSLGFCGWCSTEDVGWQRIFAGWSKVEASKLENRYPHARKVSKFRES